jgi:hypothetical protein
MSGTPTPFAAESNPGHSIPSQAIPRGPEFVVPTADQNKPPDHTPALHRMEFPVASKSAKAPTWNTIFAISLAILASVYAVASLVKAYLFMDEADTLTTVLNDPHAMTMQELRSLGDLQRSTGLHYVALLYVTVIAFTVWMLVLRSQLKTSGRVHVMRGIWAMRMWHVGVVISLITLWMASPSSAGSTLPDYIAADHRYTLYMLIRAVIGGLSVWLAISLRAATNPALAADHTPEDVYKISQRSTI